MTVWVLTLLTATAAFAAERSKKKYEPPPATPPACAAALAGSSGLDRYAHPSLELGAPERAIVEAMATDPLFKSRVMARTHLLFGGDRKKTQPFLTIAAPEDVRRAVEQLDPARGEAKAFARKLRAALDLSPEQLDDDAYAFHADEIQDLLPRPPGEPAKASETTFRFATRNLADLAAFEKFDDGYSVSRAHYAKSLRQFANGGYQILYVHRGGLPVAKLGLTAALVNEQPAILVDFIEVDYRYSVVDERWGNNDARVGVNDVLRFLAERFEHSGRGVFGLVESKTSWVQRRILLAEKFGAPAAYAGQAVHARVAQLDGSEVEYRVLEPRHRIVFTEEERDPLEPKTRALVLAPAFAGDPSLAARLEDAAGASYKPKRERLLAEVARALTTRQDLMARMKEIYALPPAYAVGQAFLVKKLDLFFPSRHDRPNVYSKSFVVGRKVFRFNPKPARVGEK